MSSLPQLHMILGQNPPAWAEQHAKEWAKYATVATWGHDQIVEVVGAPYEEFCQQVQDPRLRANYARHWLIYLFGGAYADWDTEPVSDPFRIDEWGDRFVIAPHPTMIPRVDNCFMWVREPKHPIAKKILDKVDFTQLTANQITRLTVRDEDRLRLDMPWNRNRQTDDAIIRHYYTGASLNRFEVDWLIERFAGKRVTEAGCGLRSIELAETCDLYSIEHQPMFADRCRRGGCNVTLDEDLSTYPQTFAYIAFGCDFALIDGRRRNQCFSELVKSGFDETVYLHDSKRDRYKTPDGWGVVEECTGSERGLVALARC